MRLTIDSSEPLDDAMRVLGALYGVRLVIAGDNGTENDAPAATPTGTSRGKPTGKATRKSSTRRRAEMLATPTSAAGAGKPPARKRVSGGRRQPASAANAEIRAWARDHGMTVSGRGRIPGAVMTAYHEAQAR